MEEISPQPFNTWILIWNKFWEAAITSALRKELKYMFPSGGEMLRLWMLNVWQRMVQQSTIQHGNWRKKTKHQHYLEMPIRRYSVLLSHSLLPLVSGESIPGHCGSWCLIHPQTPERQSNSKESKVKAQPARSWLVRKDFILIYTIGIFANFGKCQPD